MNFEYIILIIITIFCGILIYKSWNYCDRKKEEANNEAKNIIKKAEAEAEDIIFRTNQEFVRLEEIKNKLNLRENSLKSYEAELENKKQNLLNDRAAIESKIKKLNELIDTIKHIIMSDKKFKYDLRKRLRKIFMEYNA